jgi:hypothetical protein
MCRPHAGYPGLLSGLWGVSNVSVRSVSSGALPLFGTLSLGDCLFPSLGSPFPEIAADMRRQVRAADVEVIEVK